MASEPAQIATQEEMYRNRIPLTYRDSCAHILIPLTKCRQETCYAPWKCHDLKHAYEVCQYKDFKRRMEILKQKKAEEAEE